MNRWFWALGLILLTAVAARAERVPSQKTEVRAIRACGPSSPCR